MPTHMPTYYPGAPPGADPFHALEREYAAALARIVPEYPLGYFIGPMTQPEPDPIAIDEEERLP